MPQWPIKFKYPSKIHHSSWQWTSVITNLCHCSGTHRSHLVLLFMLQRLPVGKCFVEEFILNLHILTEGMGLCTKQYQCFTFQFFYLKIQKYPWKFAMGTEWNFQILLFPLQAFLCYSGHMVSTIAQYK